MEDYYGEPEKKWNTRTPNLSAEHVDFANIKILGLDVQDIARLKIWFESATGGKNVTMFWQEAFDAGVKQALTFAKLEAKSNLSALDSDEAVEVVVMAILDKLVKMDVPLSMGDDCTTLAKASLQAVKGMLGGNQG
jgi:hypothetical protein